MSIERRLRDLANPLSEFMSDKARLDAFIEASLDAANEIHKLRRTHAKEEANVKGQVMDYQTALEAQRAYTHLRKMLSGLGLVGEAHQVKQRELFWHEEFLRLCNIETDADNKASDAH